MAFNAALVKALTKLFLAKSKETAPLRSFQENLPPTRPVPQLREGPGPGIDIEDIIERGYDTEVNIRPKAEVAQLRKDPTRENILDESAELTDVDVFPATHNQRIIDAEESIARLPTLGESPSRLGPEAEMEAAINRRRYLQELLGEEDSAIRQDPRFYDEVKELREATIRAESDKAPRPQVFGGEESNTPGFDDDLIPTPKDVVSDADKIKGELAILEAEFPNERLNPLSDKPTGKFQRLPEEDFTPPISHGEQSVLEVLESGERTPHITRLEATNLTTKLEKSLSEVDSLKKIAFDTLNDLKAALAGLPETHPAIKGVNAWLNRASKVSTWVQRIKQGRSSASKEKQLEILTRLKDDITKLNDELTGPAASGPPKPKPVIPTSPVASAREQLTIDAIKGQ